MRKLTGVITAMTLALFGTVVAAEPAHAVAPTPRVCTVSTVLPTSTNVDPQGWGDLKNAQYVPGGIQLTATATDEAYAYVDFLPAIPLSQIGDLSTSSSNGTGTFGIILQAGTTNIHYDQGGPYWTVTPGVFATANGGIYSAPDLTTLLSDPAITEVAVWVNPGGSLLLHSQNYGCQTQPFDHATVAAGTPTITGTPGVGATLTAAPGTWDPADATLTYQWLRDGTEISGATVKTYTMVKADAGTSIAVAVSGAKDGYTPATATSAAVTVSIPPTPKVCTASTVLPTSTNADPQGWGDLKNGQYVAGGIQLTATASDEAYAYVDFLPAIPLSQIGDLSTSSSNATGTFGIILQAGKTNIHYEGGAYWTVTPGVFATANDGIYGAPDLTTLLSDPAITEVAVWVNPGGSLLLHSQNYGCQTQPFAYAMVAGSPTITGTPAVGSVLTAAPGTWDPADATLTYQWLRDGKTTIKDATGATYSPVTADLGHTLAVSVTGTKAGYTSDTVVSPVTVPVGAAPGTFRSVSPSRLLDTRITGPKLGWGQSLSLKVTGAGGVPSTGVSAVVLNVTVTDTTTPGYLTVSPTGTARPVVSNLNWSAGATIPNAVTVKVGTNGSIDLSQSGPGSAQVIVDVAGYYIDGDVTAAGAFSALTPARILDTRTTGGPLAYAETRDLQILGSGGVPADNVSAVVLNTTVTDTTATGFLTVFPTGTTRPTASNLNWVPGLTIPNLVTVKVGAGGKVSMFQSGPGTANVVVDLAGYYLGGDATLPGTFVALSPTRVLDTRSSSPVAGLSNRTLPILGVGGIPASGVSAVVVNTTVTDTTSAGFLTVYPGTESWPTASNLNWSAANTTIPNLVTVQVGTDGSLKLHNGSGTSCQVVADIAGYYIGS